MDDKEKIILIVDDIELNRAILNDLFYREYCVVEAENGEEALEFIERYGDKIAIILLDIMMPVMDGFGVLREMTNRHLIDKYPVFLITAEDSDEVINRGYDMGVVDVIHKPFNPSVIRRRVGNTVELYARRFHMESIIEEQTRELENQADKLKETSLAMVDALSTVIEFRDCESGQHIQRIRRICKSLITEIMKVNPSYGFSSQQIEEISVAAAMHDIGKIAIPDYILNKPGKLTFQEFEIMKEHTIRGCEILESVPYIHDSSSYRYYYDICRWHHEKWDGNGYPDGIKGDEIPIWAQVVALADCYDALISKRVYKPAYPHAQAIRMIIRGECGAFNPILLDCFSKVSKTLESLKPDDETQVFTSKYMHLKPEELMPPARDAVGQSLAQDGVTDRTLRLLEMERERYRVLTDMTKDIIFTYYRQSDTIEFSDRYKEIFHDETKYGNVKQAMAVDDRIRHSDRVKLFAKIDRLSLEDRAFHMELQLKVDGGKYLWYEIFVYSIWDEDNPDTFISLLGKLTDISKQKEEVNMWKQQASLDSLTGLLNRKTMERTIEELTSGKEKQPFAFLMLDIDNFKNINDGLGHLFGDHVLREVARIILSKLRASDVIGRIGGDEFVIIMKDICEEESIRKKAQDICEAFRSAVTYDGKSINISSSIGISRFPFDGGDYEILLKKADIALYATKRGGKDGYTFYKTELEENDYSPVLSEVDNEI